MLGNDIRKAFLDYFAQKGHTIVESSSLVPHNDPTLLFTNAGMVQFKDLFTGMEKRAYSRAVTSQKCVRAGGKHNDLDTVGRTARHHTFFEMLGNFSFGDYFKKDAIIYAWEFLTDTLGLPKDKLWITIFLDDDEAKALWLETTEVPEERIIRLGEKDNFWAMGDTGPCGPCSEIIFDRGMDYSCGREDCAIGVCDCARWLEIWNLVFMQFERSADGTLTPLPSPSIDTGMGLERITSIIQDVGSNYDTDLLHPLLHWVEKRTDKTYDPGEAGFPFRVISDHARSCTFLIADGVIPGNEGRGYVLRRILRRAVRFGKILGIDKPFLYELVDEVAALMGDAYPQLREKRASIRDTIEREEKKFQETIIEGMKMAGDMVQTLKERGEKEISGQSAFILYDTFGFPLDLTKDLAEENQMIVDEEGFHAEMEAQRERARSARDDSKAWDFSSAMAAKIAHLEKTGFVGYGQTHHKTEILAIFNREDLVEKVHPNDEVLMILRETPFYPEGGGQIGDQGVLSTNEGTLFIVDTKKLPDEKIVHIGKVIDGTLAVHDSVIVEVDSHRRINTARNHTATHLLHQALRDILGTHVNQAGSLVTPQRMRFDFTHHQPVTDEELKSIEDQVNRMIQFNTPVLHYETSLEKAKEEGAAALFGEKYGEQVRVVQISGYSLELCGGTHVSNTAEITLFKIVSEGGIGSGLRRIEAITGPEALQHLNRLEGVAKNLARILKTDVEHVEAKATQLIQENKDKGRDIEKLTAKMAKQQSQDLFDQVVEVNGVKLLAVKVEARNMDMLRSTGDAFINRIGSGVVALAAEIDGKANFVVMATKDATAKGAHAGHLIRDIASIAGGGGGGRPDMAQAGAKEPEKIDEALAAAKDRLAQQIK